MPDKLIETYRIFVYGTLMKNARNESLLVNAKCVDGSAYTKEATFLMRQFNSSSSKGKFTPAVTKNGNARIQGEVYEVDEGGLSALDTLEQNGIRYQREEVALQDGSKAWMYFLIVHDKPSIDQSRIGYDKSTNSFFWKRREGQACVLGG